MVYFLIYLFLEVMISSTIAGLVGGLAIFLEIVLTAILGITILKNFKFSLMENIEKARSGQMTQDEFIRTNVGRAIGAVLLIVPGFFTDIMGVLMLIGLLPFLVSKLFQFKTPNQTNYQTNGHQSGFDHTKSNFNNTTYKGIKNDEIIDVEIIDDTKPIK
ncbi:MAG: FxsA family protein [Campylobacterota bacterium]|nr:FxsA family protein [Campylobacterota bacterium]